MSSTATSDRPRLAPPQLQPLDYMPDADFSILRDHSTASGFPKRITFQIETKLDLTNRPDIADDIEGMIEDMTPLGRAKLYLKIADLIGASFDGTGLGVAVLQAACGVIPRDDPGARRTAGNIIHGK